MEKYNATIKIVKIILIIVWMIIVFYFSAQKGTNSSNTSQSFTEFLIQTFTGGNIELEENDLDIIEGIIRKLAHYSIYALGGFLIMNYAYNTNRSNKQKSLYSIMFGAGYAITDEIHQFFVPGRSARVLDVGIDTLGVITGVLIYILIRNINIKNF